MGLLFQAEPTEKLKRRFREALYPVYTYEGLVAGKPRPGEQRKHVFDFEDGTRMIVSHEKLGQRLYLHASFSMDNQCHIKVENFPNACYVKICELAGIKLTPIQRDMTAKTLHLLFEPIHVEEEQASSGE